MAASPSGKKKQKKLSDEKQSFNKILYTVVVVILSAVALVCGKLSRISNLNLGHIDAAPFQVHVIDVGQGDSILVEADGHYMLVDGAESGEAAGICQYLTDHGVTELEYIVMTHPHADHIGGLPAVMQSFPPKNVLEPVMADKLIPTTKGYEKYLDAVEASGASLKEMQAGDLFRLGRAEVTVVAPVSADAADDLNNASLVLRVQYKDCVCLLTGDMEVAEEKTVLASGADLDADFLKAGHHGSNTSSSEALLDAVTPQFVAVSCGKDNRYGHPGAETMERFQQYASQIRVTAECGSILFQYDPVSGKMNMEIAS